MSPALSHVKVSWRRGELRVPACYQAWRGFFGWPSRDGQTHAYVFPCWTASVQKRLAP